MSPARRSLKRRDWPRGLREPRPGYYAWEAPDGKVWGIGAVPLEQAKQEAIAANLHVQQQAARLVSRLQGAGETMADLLDLMPAPANKNTAKSVRSMDRKIRAALGAKPAADITVKDCAQLLDAEVAAGRIRTAEALRSRLSAVCRKGMAKGWMESNPAEVTEKPVVTIKRGRLTLEMFRAIYAAAPQVSEWLQHAMMLALVTGQDRSTVAAMKRRDGADEHLTVWRTKTRDTNQPVAIPLRLRLDVVGVTLADLVAHRTGVVSRHLVHHVNPWGNAPAGSPVHPDRMSHAFTEARKLAKIPDTLPDGKGAPTFHELRSLAKRLYDAQGNVDTKALLGHAEDSTAAIYADPRGAEPIRVRVG
jgi:enterobacteria phage integrase